MSFSLSLSKQLIMSEMNWPNDVIGLYKISSMNLFKLFYKDSKKQKT